MKTYSSTHPSTDRQSALANYFKDMAGHTLLDAQGESTLASALRQAEEGLWQIVLGREESVSEICTLIEGALPTKKKTSFRNLRSHATRSLRNPSTKTQATFQRNVQKTATLMRELDPDQEILSDIIVQIQNGLWKTLETNASQRKAKKIRASVTELKVLRKEAARIRNRFVEANLGLVVSVAKKYRFSGLGLSDLIQEGNLGLLKAVARFDERRGFRFSTYATWWIRHAVGRSVSDKSRTVRVPVHVMESHQKIKKVRRELSASLGREPKNEEVAKAAEMDLRKVERIISNARAHSVSLDAPLGEDGDRERMEVFSTDTKDSAFEKMASLALSNRATLALDTLAPIEIEILHRRFGLAGKTATTLQEIANHIGKSRERIRQIQEKALMKLREQLLAEQAI